MPSLSTAYLSFFDGARGRAALWPLERSMPFWRSRRASAARSIEAMVDGARSAWPGLAGACRAVLQVASCACVSVNVM